MKTALIYYLFFRQGFGVPLVSNRFGRHRRRPSSRCIDFGGPSSFFFWLVGWLTEDGVLLVGREFRPGTSYKFNAARVGQSEWRNGVSCAGLDFFFSENQRDPVPITPRKTASRDRLRHVIDASRRRVSCFFFNVFVASFFLFVFSYFGA